jgi:glycosyltransferase involved in cell wall biosynthesis
MANDKLITFVIVTYNNEDVLERCLLSIKPYADKILIITDSDCNKETLDIAHKYTNNVVISKHHAGYTEYYYENIRELVDTGWLFLIDPDEVLTTELGDKLRYYTTLPYDGYWVHWLWYEDNKLLRLGLNKPYKQVLFKTDKVKISSQPHGERFVPKFGWIEEVLMHKPPKRISESMNEKLSFYKIAATRKIELGEANHSAMYYVIYANIGLLLRLIYFYIYRLYIRGFNKSRIMFAWRCCMYFYKLNLEIAKIKFHRS